MDNTFRNAIVIMRMRPGSEIEQQALELLVQRGPAKGAQWILASADAHLYVSLVNLEQWDASAVAMYAPYFDMETIPVCNVDDRWAQTMSELINRDRSTKKEPAETVQKR